MEKVKTLITHNDLDGYGCNLVFMVYNQTMGIKNDPSDIVNCTNNNVDEKTREKVEVLNPREDEIIFADICCSKELLIELKQKGFSVKVFDHHPTNMYAVEVLGDDATIVPKTPGGIPESGTSLLYQYLITLNKYLAYPYIAKFVDSVRSYDTWEWKSTNNLNAKYLNILFWSLGPKAFVAKYYNNLIQYKSTYSYINRPLFDESDMEFIKAKIENEQAAIDKITPESVIDVDIRGYKGALILGNIGANIGEFATQFLEKYPQYDLVCGFFMYNNNSTFEFRCIRDDIDLGKDVAAPIGGGGHPKAAGAPVSDLVKVALIEMIKEELNK